MSESIDGFQDFKWFDSAEDVLENKTVDLKEDIDFTYETDEDNDFACLRIFKSSVAGYDAEEEYNFLENRLFSAGYLISFDSNSNDYVERAYNDIIEKYIGKYGDIAGTSDDTNDDTYDGRLSYWADEKRNIITIKDYLSSTKKQIEIFYILGDNRIEEDETLSDMLNVYYDRTEREFGVNVRDEVKRIGNTEGI